LKKLIIRPKWKRYLRRHAVAQEEASLAFKHRKRVKNGGKQGRPAKRRRRFKDTVSVTAPDNFSLIHNPNGTIAFLDDVRVAGRKANVFVDLRGIKTLTSDAIAALLAVIKLDEAPPKISGNRPNDPRLREMLESSGFLEHVEGGTGAGARRVGSIQRELSKGNEKFDQFRAKEIIDFALKHFGSRKKTHQATYSVLGEAMLNTVYHASAPGYRREPWCASVFCDDERRRACFTFIDQGVGIFRSQKFRGLVRIFKNLGVLSHADVLKKMMDGQIRSRSGLRGRGNGIPGINRHCKAKRIRELRIIANQAMGNGETDVYTQLETPFPGTILYWEVEL
jgi:hypothetical protein